MILPSKRFQRKINGQHFTLPEVERLEPENGEVEPPKINFKDDFPFPGADFLRWTSL